MSWDLLPDARAAAERTKTYTSSETVLLLAVQNAFHTAIAAGNKTFSVSVGAAAPRNVILVKNQLNLLGFTVTYTGTTLTVSWVV